MPLDEKILGSSNRWYKAAIDTANEFEIERDIRIRVAQAIAGVRTVIATS